MLPRRNRFKFVLRKERFGGKPCANELSTCTKHANNDTICWMKEDCVLCPEHCDKPDLPSDERSPINYPAIPYPGKDPRCVGYCPGKKHISNNYIYTISSTISISNSEPLKNLLSLFSFRITYFLFIHLNPTCESI